MNIQSNDNSPQDAAAKPDNPNLVYIGRCPVCGKMGTIDLNAEPLTMQAQIHGYGHCDGIQRYTYTIRTESGKTFRVDAASEQEALEKCRHDTGLSLVAPSATPARQANP